uniref:C-type lectin domain-containing protein n=1 Tax=Xiphophorus couchianus TaxID=32473 RepID=A0A3B5ME80_9TELE
MLMMLVTYICTFSFLCILQSGLDTGYCSAPWVPYNGHCFRLYQNAQSWSGAQMACRKDGGDLASIRNMEDNSFVTSELGYGTPIFISIFLLVKNQDVFEWTSTVNFQHWLDGEPNNKNNVESCVEFSSRDWDESGSWNDNQCETRNGWVCQIRTGKTWLWHTVI